MSDRSLLLTIRIVAPTGIGAGLVGTYLGNNLLFGALTGLICIASWAFVEDHLG